VDAYFLRGEAQQMVKQYEAAAASYDEVLRRTPNHTDALNNRGNACHALGQHERALKDYDKALELNPAKASVHNNRGLAIKALGDHPLAIACFHEAIAPSPTTGSLTSTSGYQGEQPRSREALGAAGSHAEQAADHRISVGTRHRGQGRSSRLGRPYGTHQGQRSMAEIQPPHERMGQGCFGSGDG
jgi:tetratricopeptide (TPR) repeat protein